MVLVCLSWFWLICWTVFGWFLHVFSGDFWLGLFLLNITVYSGNCKDFKATKSHPVSASVVLVHTFQTDIMYVLE